MATLKRIYTMTFASVYPHYVTKIERKGRTVEELHEVIEWLCGYDEGAIQDCIDHELSFEVFFDRAPQLNPNAEKITGMICGYRIEEIEDPLLRKIRYLDKLVDELAKGRKMSVILRK